MTRLKTFAGIAALLLSFATILPAEVYQYTGMDYTSVAGPYATSEFVSGTFTLTDPLAANASGFSPTPTSWTITDGVNTLCDTCAGSTLVNIYFSTNSMDNIRDWFFEATNTGAGVQVYSAGPVGINADSATTGSDSAGAPIGTWQDTSPTPEPGTLGLTLAGSLLLIGTLRRRANKSFIPA